MAWYYGTYSCGHEGRVNIIGQVKDRQWKADNKFSGLCEECYEKRLLEEREKTNEEAAEKAKEMELPELSGSEKQVAWANTIRQQEFIEGLGILSESDIKYYAKLYEIKGLSKENVDKIIEYIVINNTKATWYIDRRNCIVGLLLKEYLEKIEKVEVKKIEEITTKDIKLEATVQPEERKHIGTVEIEMMNNIIKAKYEKNEDFIKIVKSLGYKWNGVWQREINLYSGPIEDRMAELGNKLLTAGFAIMIYNDDVRQKAIEGIFEPECTRWIALRTTGDYEGWLSIRWFEKNDDLYREARKITGSKWSSPSVVVKIDYYKEIEDFAEINGFNFSTGARDAIEKYKESQRGIPVVKAKKAEAPKTKDKLQEILESDTDVLDDLKDD